MEKNLKGKTALVTGSTSGIGLGILEAFGAEGCNLVMNGFRDAAEIRRLQAEIKESHGVEVIYSGADMKKPEEIRGMMAAAEKTFGGVDILVNNAGIQNVQPIDEFSDEKWDDIIAINLSSAFHTIKAAAPAMKRQGWG
ncbi:MAG: SDR family NAD(P)-dependent oxidoreductase, partial [Alphaproteobacteria bacterium]|nr:SDR family NAD(P)-dependent oxidoreductase [Alphaproteobacteria bacterium]